MRPNATRSIKKRDTDTDIMRIVAAFFVVMIHATGLETLSGTLYNAAARFSVPVFVLISGYYMLSKPLALPSLFRRAGTLFLIMLVWSAIYYAADWRDGLLEGSGGAYFITYLLTKPLHLWYMYAAITLYLFTPVLYIFCEHAGRKEYRYALALTFFFGSVIMMLLRSGLSPVLADVIEQMKAPYTLGFIFLYLAGGYLRRYEPERPAFIYIIGILGTITTCAAALILPPQQASNLALSFFAPNTMLAGIAFFVLLKRLYTRRPIAGAAARGIIGELADCTAGIYFVHVLCLRLLDGVFCAGAPFLMMPLKTLSAFCLSAAVIFLLRRIPVLRSLLLSS